MKLRDISRRLLAVTALVALLAANTPALADSLSAANPAACCNTVYCPLHHSQGRNMQKDKANCDSHGKTGAADSLMRACDDTAHQVMGDAPFTLTAPVTIFYETMTEPAPLSLAAFFPFVISLPSTPPPRTLPS
jgi:hypothetical protein